MVAGKEVEGLIRDQVQYCQAAQKDWEPSNGLSQKLQLVESRHTDISRLLLLTIRFLMCLCYNGSWEVLVQVPAMARQLIHRFF